MPAGSWTYLAVWASNGGQQESKKVLGKREEIAAVLDKARETPVCAVCRALGHNLSSFSSVQTLTMEKVD